MAKYYYCSKCLNLSIDKENVKNCCKEETKDIDIYIQKGKENE